MGASHHHRLSEAVLVSATIDITTVTDSIAALTIAGVTVKDSNEIPEAIGLGTSILFPRPDNFVTDLQITRAEITGQNLDVSYTLNYHYVYCAIGGGLGTYAVYSQLLTNIGAIVVAFSKHETLTGAVDNDGPTIGTIGQITDPAGNSFWGCDVSIHIKQFLEV
jgi:hypothetical protein